jgi:broad specificity phosphatase PhoE
MAKKIIYFVRHGETENNALNIKQDAQGGLDEKGRTQVLTTAKRFPKEHGRPQIIIASPFERTKETAEIIANEIGIKKMESDILGDKVKMHFRELNKRLF